LLLPPGHVAQHDENGMLHIYLYREGEVHPAREGDNLAWRSRRPGQLASGRAPRGTHLPQENKQDSGPPPGGQSPHAPAASYPNWRNNAHGMMSDQRRRVATDHRQIGTLADINAFNKECTRRLGWAT
jgi:hypothetical protein